MTDRNSNNFAFIIALLISLIVLLKTHSVVTYRSPHVDDYYHSVLTNIACAQGHLKDVYLPYASLPLYFLYGCMTSQVLGGVFSNTINVSNYLYFIFVFVVIIYLYVIMRCIFISIYNLRKVFLSIIVYILPFTVSYLHYPCSAPHIYAFTLYLCILYVLLSGVFYQKPLRYHVGLYFLVCVLSLAISYSHHLTQLVLLSTVAAKTFVELAMCKRVNKDAIYVSTIILLTVFLSMAFSWITGGFGGFIKNFLTLILFEIFTEKLQTAVFLTGINIPRITYLLSSIKRVFMIVYIIIPLFIIMKKFYYLITTKEAYTDPETEFYVAYIIGAAPTILTAPMALERPLIFLAPLLLLQIVKFISQERYYYFPKFNLYKHIFTIVVTILSLSLVIITLLHNEFYYGLGAPHVRYIEDQIIDTITNFLIIRGDSKILTDFWISGILRYYVISKMLNSNILYTNINDIVNRIIVAVINEYSGEEFRSAIKVLNNVVSCEIYIILERTIIRTRVFYPDVDLNVCALATSLKLVFNAYYGFIFVS